MEDMTIAIPSEMPGGLDAGLGQHFGHCPIYTIVEAKNGKVANVSTLNNVEHVQGGCMAPVNLLAQHGVTALIAGGMGYRPLMGFNQVGIRVFHGGNFATVGQAVDALLAGQLPIFSSEFTCGGGH